MIPLNKLCRAIAASACIALSFASTAATQASPNLVNGGNLWTITAFDDSSPVHTQWATQGICFEFIGIVGTHTRYRWRSTTFPDWNGIASQEGDEVFMHGDYARDVGHDGMKWSVTTAKTGAGHWFEWREDGGFGLTIGFANAQLQRVGTCPTTGPFPTIPNQYFSDGTLVETPIGLPLKQ